MQTESAYLNLVHDTLASLRSKKSRCSLFVGQRRSPSLLRAQPNGKMSIITLWTDITVNQEVGLGSIGLAYPAVTKKKGKTQGGSKKYVGNTMHRKYSTRNQEHVFYPIGFFS